MEFLGELTIGYSAFRRYLRNDKTQRGNMSDVTDVRLGEKN
jgi:hypothetical protein